MKRKPVFRGDGLAFSELLYGSKEKLPTPPNKNNCIKNCNPSIAAKDGRNMAQACRSVKGDPSTADKVLNSLNERYCSKCQILFKESFWQEMEGENE